MREMDMQTVPQMETLIFAGKIFGCSWLSKQTQERVSYYTVFEVNNKSKSSQVNLLIKPSWGTEEKRKANKSTNPCTEKSCNISEM